MSRDRVRNGRNGCAVSFQFYPQDFLASASVGAMTLEERGAYITLLAHAWLDGGSLPTDIERLADALRVDPQTATRLMAGRIGRCWTERDGRWRNARMDRELRVLEEFRAAMSAAGRRGNDARRKKSDASSRVGDARRQPGDSQATARRIPGVAPSPSPSPSPSPIPSQSVAPPVPGGAARARARDAPDGAQHSPRRGRKKTPKSTRAQLEAALEQIRRDLGREPSTELKDALERYRELRSRMKRWASWDASNWIAQWNRTERQEAWLIATLEESFANAYQGLFPDKHGTNQPNHQTRNGSRKPGSIHEVIDLSDCVWRPDAGTDGGISATPPRRDRVRQDQLGFAATEDDGARGVEISWDADKSASVPLG